MAEKIYKMKGKNMNYLWTDNAMQSGTPCNVDVVNENLMHLKYSNNALTPFCVNSGNLDATGKASLLAYSAGALSFKIGESYPNAELTYADFSKETLQSLPGISSMSNGANTIIKEKGQNPVATQRNITSGVLFPSSPTDGDYHLFTGCEPIRTYKYVNSAWVETQYVIIGTATVSAGVITAVTTYPYNQNGYVTNIDTILQQNAPDYGRMVAKAWNTTFIAPCSGYLVMKTVQVVSYTSYITINGSTVAHSRNDRGDNGICSYQNIAINKGDCYVAQGTAQQLYFVPSKGGII